MASFSEHREIFKHEALDLEDKKAIRLLTILPRDNEDIEDDDDDHPIRCTLRHATTKDDYVCLSYVWGPEEGQHEIEINGRRMLIRCNLYEFLKVARSRRAREDNMGLAVDFLSPMGSFERSMEAIWIDAICIDQTNTTEKNHQVQQMGHIFGRSHRTIAWLGAHPQLAANLVLMKNSIAFRTRLLDPDPEEIRELEYWKRAWITQEIVLARNVWYVASFAAIDEVTMTRLLWLRNAEFLGCRDSLPMVKNMLDMSRFPKAALYETLMQFSRKDCFDFRDRVYSLLSMTSDGHKLDVDYNISRPQLAAMVIQLYAGSNFCIYDAILAIIELCCKNRSDSRYNDQEIDLAFLELRSSNWAAEEAKTSGGPPDIADVARSPSSHQYDGLPFVWICHDCGYRKQLGKEEFADIFELKDHIYLFCFGCSSQDQAKDPCLHHSHPHPGHMFLTYREPFDWHDTRLYPADSQSLQIPGRICNVSIEQDKAVVQFPLRNLLREFEPQHQRGHWRAARCLRQNCSSCDNAPISKDGARERRWKFLKQRI